MPRTADFHKDLKGAQQELEHESAGRVPARWWPGEGAPGLASPQAGVMARREEWGLRIGC